VFVTLHQTDILPCLPGSIQITDAHKIESFFLESEANFLGLSYSKLSKFTSLVTLDDSLKIGECLTMPHKPEID
jgi:hypothetical protein